MSGSSTSSTDPGTTPARLLLHHEAGIHHVSFPRGAVDGVAVREMYELAAELMDSRNLKLLFDFTGVNMLSSGVMGMLVTIRKKLMHVGGQLHIAVPNRQALEAFHVMNLHLLLSLHEDVEKARTTFKA